MIEPTVGLVETVPNEWTFKQLCDGLLRYEVGPLAQTFGAKGRDDGVDAEFEGSYGGVEGRWVFQYKFSAPEGGLRARRDRIAQPFLRKSRNEFTKPGVRGADGYVLMTNVPMTRARVARLREAWVSKSNHGARLLVWDPSSLNLMLRGREHLARSWSGIVEEKCRLEIVLPLFDLVEHALAVLEQDKQWMWPLMLSSRQAPVRRDPLLWEFVQVSKLALTASPRAPDRAMSHVLWTYACETAFPNALAAADAVAKAVASLLASLTSTVEATIDEVAKLLPEATTIGPTPEKPELARDVLLALAFIVVGARCGDAPGFLRDDVLHVHSDVQRQVYAGPELRDAKRRLHDLVTSTMGCPEDIATARVSLAASLRDLRAGLWFVAELGVDAPFVEQGEPLDECG